MHLAIRIIPAIVRIPLLISAITTKSTAVPVPCMMALYLLFRGYINERMFVNLYARYPPKRWRSGSVPLRETLSLVEEPVKISYSYNHLKRLATTEGQDRDLVDQSSSKSFYYDLSFQNMRSHCGYFVRIGMFWYLSLNDEDGR